MTIMLKLPHNDKEIKKDIDRFMRNMTTYIYQVVTMAQISLHDGTVVVVIV